MVRAYDLSGAQVHMQRGGLTGGKLISGDNRGDVFISDPRMSDSISRITAHQVAGVGIQESLHTFAFVCLPQSRPLNCLAVHDHVPLMAR